MSWEDFVIDFLMIGRQTHAGVVKLPAGETKADVPFHCGELDSERAWRRHARGVSASRRDEGAPRKIAASPDLCESDA
jgi:hypothetical protein